MPITEKLRAHISEFLPTLRLGIDFGEYAGGIALVRGNDVIHAETCLDFHSATIEQRRILRRGRRSRHARKMRLARLRSWVLRQRVNGKRLPDSYAVMHDPRFMVQPTVYRSSGVVPQEVPSWIDFVKQGRGGAAAFVRALTLIFQKRGYKWDAIALDEMSDSKLKDFLLTARLPAGDRGLLDQIRLQIKRRRDDPSHPVRGKTKVPPEELEILLSQAVERGKQPPRPRMAEHRSVKEAELRAVVDGFARSSGLPDDVSNRWKTELCQLLNRSLRPARFNNRLKSGCAWCGKSTPRKARVRELAYRAAVNNLRIREGFRTRPLTIKEQEPFLEWWGNAEHAPALKTIQKRLSQLGTDQEKMARQFHDLLTNKTPKGRASLCIEHLKMAAQGKTLKDAGVPWQTIAVRRAPNPCGEARDERILRRLEALLFHPGRRGPQAWRHGPVSIINLEIPEPATEQSAPGQQTARKVESLKERLENESQGCIYKVLGGCSGEIHKDHVFPRSRGGPDLQMNLVAACNAHNDEKGDRTPYEWLQGPHSQRWKQFAAHVRSLSLPETKKRILLSLNPDGTHADDYPSEDPTPLARIGARPRQFVIKLGELFARYGVEPPRLAYELGKPLVQRIRGSETHWYRLSFHKTPDGQLNFPYPKDRSTLFHHAEDAALLASVPPHTWRPLVRIHTARRLLLSGNEGEKAGLVTPELAPNWAAFLQNRRRPLVHILGRYQISWKNKFADLTFWREPMADTPRIKRSKLLKDICGEDIKNIYSPQFRPILQQFADSVGLGPKETLAHALARQMAGPNAKRKEIQLRLPQAEEELSRRFPPRRRLQVFSQKGGTIALIKPADGPPRKIQIKPASEGLILWQVEKARKRDSFETQISILRPLPLLRLGFPRIDPPLPAGAREVGRLYRHQLIWLDARPDRPAGFYRVTKCQLVGATVVPEEVIPKEIVRRLEGYASEVRSEEDDSRSAPALTLGKQELLKYFH
jgi:5-methylcytosine-specific restriction endonuclease McrA